MPDRRSFLRIAACFTMLMAIGAPRAFPKAHSAVSGPRLIMIIRHAEKPSSSGDPNLSPTGYKRADALATVIPDDFTRPDFLIATRKSKSSNRPVETITPLARSLHEPIESTYKDDDVELVARAVLTESKYAGKVVLICWHHEKIPALAKALGADDAPAKWSSDVFDRVWEITYDGETPEFANLPQKALPGDSAK